MVKRQQTTRGGVFYRLEQIELIQNISDISSEQAGCIIFALGFDTSNNSLSIFHIMSYNPNIPPYSVITTNKN